MTRHLTPFVAGLAVLSLAACGGSDSSDDADPSTDSVAPAPEPEPDPGPAPTGEGCPYLSDDALTAAIGKDATLDVGDQGGCQWSFPDGSQGLVSRFPADYFEDRAETGPYIGDIDGVTGRWGNANAMVLIDGEFTLTFNGPLQSPPLRDEMQAVGRALAEAN